jgi:hypothetical protein
MEDIATSSIYQFILASKYARLARAHATSVLDAYAVYIAG